MTVQEFNPRFTNEEDWACRSVDDSSPWCLAISDCIWNYMFRFYEIECEVKTCEWPLTEYSFNYCKKSKFCRDKVKNFKTYQEYLASDPKVEYSTYIDNQFYGLKNTDGTCNFAYQNEDWIFVIRIKSDGWRSNTKNQEGFGCVIGKETGELHCVSLGEDDGNYWGDHDIPENELKDYDWGYVTSVINNLSFPTKSYIIEKIFRIVKSL